MRRFYTRIRIALMCFAVGLGAVYMADGFSTGEVYVELPEAVSGDVLPVFTETPPMFRREMNCGMDPSDEHARAECSDRQLFGDRDLSLYDRLEVVCDVWPNYGYHHYVSSCDADAVRGRRRFVWEHWRDRKRAHLISIYSRRNGKVESHFFVEPISGEMWSLLSVARVTRKFIVDAKETEVQVISDFLPWSSYRNPRWKIATDSDRPYGIRVGEKYLEFESATGDTAVF